MRSLARPKPDYTYDVQAEVTRLIQYKEKVHVDSKSNRHIPAVGQSGKVLIATWNIANLGVHKRRDADCKIIAEILSWFEIIAIQEVADNLNDLSEVMKCLPTYFSLIFNDRAGNDERAAYIYDTRRVSLGPKVGEVVIVESDRGHIKLPNISRTFDGFNRNPFLASFQIESTNLVIANCHLLYGKQSPVELKKESMEKRQLEAYALARWCDLRRKDKHAWSTNIIAVGDFNLPKVEKNDSILKALTKRGLKLPPHDTRIPTNVSNTADYDQVTVVPGLISRITGIGVFDFDGALFEDIYEQSTPGYWRTCAKYYISDHRPLWFQFSL